jgi:hypothetical protein
MPTNTSWSNWERIKLAGEPDGMIRWSSGPGRTFTRISRFIGRRFRAILTRSA